MSFIMSQWSLVSKEYFEGWGGNGLNHGPFLTTEVTTYTNTETVLISGTYNDVYYTFTDTKTPLFCVGAYQGFNPLCTYFTAGAFDLWGVCDVLKSYDDGASWAPRDVSNNAPIRVEHDSTATYFWTDIDYHPHYQVCTMSQTSGTTTSTITKTTLFIAGPMWQDRCVGAVRFDLSSDTYIYSGTEYLWGYEGTAGGAPQVWPGTADLSSAPLGTLYGEMYHSVMGCIRPSGDAVFIYRDTPSAASTNTAISTNEKAWRTSLVEGRYDRSNYAKYCTWTNSTTNIGTATELQSISPAAMCMDTAGNAHIFVVVNQLTTFTDTASVLHAYGYAHASIPNDRWLRYFTYDTAGSFSAYEDIRLHGTATGGTASPWHYGYGGPNSGWWGHPVTYTYTATVSGTGTPAVGVAIPIEYEDGTKASDPAYYDNTYILLAGIKEGGTFTAETIVGSGGDRRPSTFYDWAAKTRSAQMFTYNGTLCCIYNSSLGTNGYNDYKFRTYLAMRTSPGTWTNILVKDDDVVKIQEGLWWGGGGVRAHARQLTSTSIGVLIDRYDNQISPKCESFSTLAGYTGYHRMWYAELTEVSTGSGAEEGYGF